MKLLTKLLILLSAIAVYAEPITLQWDASDTPGVTYTVYALRAPAAAAAGVTPLSASVVATPTITASAGTNLTVTIDVPVGVWYFVATAKLDGLESDPSNMISTMISPNKPKNIRRKLLF